MADKISTDKCLEEVIGEKSLIKQLLKKREDSGIQTLTSKSLKTVLENKWYENHTLIKIENHGRVHTSGCGNICAILSSQTHFYRKTSLEVSVSISNI